MAVSLLSASAVLFFSVIFKIELKWNYRVFKGYDDTAHILTAWIVTIINLFKQKKKKKKKNPRVELCGFGEVNRKKTKD